MLWKCCSGRHDELCGEPGVNIAVQDEFRIEGTYRLEVYCSPKTGRLRNWPHVLPAIHAGMTSISALDIGIPHHASHIFHKPAAVHHLRDVLALDRQFEGTDSSFSRRMRLLTLLVPFCTMWSAPVDILHVQQPGENPIVR